MKLASLDDGSRDGRLIVVSKRGDVYASAGTVARTLQAALDDWERAEPRLRAISEDLEAGAIAVDALQPEHLKAPLSRAFEWVDASAYINHIELVRRARGAEPPETLLTDPLVYQGGSGAMLGPREDFRIIDESFGLDFEAELCVVLGDTPQGVRPSEAESHVRLLLVANDWTYRNLIPAELAKGFGFFTSKPATAFSPFAVTLDELGPVFRGGRVHLRLETWLNETLIGDPETGPEMHFSFFDLISHITKTRAFTAGTILGSGTISNKDPARGVSCLAERRAREMIEHGKAQTSFLKTSDLVEIDLRDDNGISVCGRISERVVA